ncbi:MAG: radical SAM protein [Lachnospiraceae bacterium]|jgi:MoaA/NifB/PqqE/SkfB family radical SAM enzyme|nr:radical SAM protein [Lachnospiraceae bacterium]
MKINEKINQKLNTFLNGGIKNNFDTISRFYQGDRKGQSFLLKALLAMRKSQKTRDRHEKEGLHVPPFLIASIATECNLHCKGCYAWATGGCEEEGVVSQSVHEELEPMQPSDWGKLFYEAQELGVSFILLAGGEPLLRRDILDEAADTKGIIFPIFTNATLIDKWYVNYFDAHRNLIPVVSIEGNDEMTDARRGAGVSAMIHDAVALMRQKNLLYGVSITVTSKNVEAVLKEEFVERLREDGCGLVFFIEYVPAQEGTQDLVLSGEDQTRLRERVIALREENRSLGMILLSFPGDEKAMGGCLAAGKGFFHINSLGAAEPCPFSPYSVDNIRNTSLADILRSKFFQKVRSISEQDETTSGGGCALFRNRDVVEKLQLGEESKK